MLMLWMMIWQYASRNGVGCRSLQRGLKKICSHLCCPLSSLSSSPSFLFSSSTSSTTPATQSKVEEGQAPPHFFSFILPSPSALTSHIHPHPSPSLPSFSTTHSFARDQPTASPSTNDAHYQRRSSPSLPSNSDRPQSSPHGLPHARPRTGPARRRAEAGTHRLAPPPHT